MLRPEMAAELNYFCAMICYGVLAAFGYHILMFFRAAVRHAVPLTDAEDILFLMMAGLCFFLTAYEKNNGILRWYAFLGAGLGCFAYVRTLGAFLERPRKWLLQKCRKKGRIKPKIRNKGQVQPDEGSSPEQRKKRKKKKRS